MRKRKVALALLCSVALAASLFTGCGTDHGEKQKKNGKKTDDLSKHVDLTIGGIGITDTDSVDGWPTEVAEKLEKKFNVTLKQKS